MTAAKAARSWGVPITVLMGFREDTGRWVIQDRLMAMALQNYEDSIHTCGVPESVGFGDHNIERVEWKSTVCHACESLDSARKQDKNEIPGLVRFPVWEELPANP